MKIAIGIALLMSLQAHADFEADMEMHSLKDGKMEQVMQGKLQAKGEKHRFSVSKPMPMTMILDRASQSGHMLMEEQKMAMKTDMKKAGLEKQTKCMGEDVKSCYEKEGFIHAGTESVDGVECDVWSKKSEKEKHSFMKIWHPKKALSDNKKEVMVLKMESYDKEGGTLQSYMKVKNFNGKVSLSENLFKVPEGYQVMDMSGMGFGGRAMGGMGGGVPAAGAAGATGAPAGMPGMPKGMVMPKGMNPDMIKQMMKNMPQQKN